ncbi:MAG: hypothetical protein Q9166_000981 [cf. Caloplaca sp. 2 TL-2023]
MGIRRDRSQSQLMRARLFPTDEPRSSEAIPANTGLVILEDSSQDWPEVDSSTCGTWSGDSSIDAQVIVNISLSPNSLLATLDYSQSTLSVVSASNVATVYAKAIEEIIKTPAQSIKDMDLLSMRDLEQLRMWNQGFPPTIDSCVHGQVLRHAKVSPQAPAICSWDGDLTYQELEEMSSRLARIFMSVGIKCEALVPVCFWKSAYATVAMLAILRAGGAFVPLDPSHPADRLKAIIDKAGAKIVVTSPETARLFRDMPVKTVEVSPTIMDFSEVLLDFSLPTVRPDHAAFVLFTSGSTGKPKGIIQEHASVCTSAIAHGRAMHVTSESRVFQYAAFTFDVSMMDIFTTLICGGCVCIPSEEDRMGVFTSVMNRMQVNWVLFTPSVASLIKPVDVPTLQTLVLGGEAIKQENVSRWLGKVRLFNCYGPAECGACAIGQFTHLDSRPANIGRQFGGELCWVVDPENHNRLLPIGAVGELVVEGPTLARGYLDDLAKTQAAFIKSPDWPQGAGHRRPRRIYKTGDLVRQNSDGTFDFVGRKDLQVKVRGQRVEIGEVEHHISTYPGIALSMVTRPQSGPYAQTLIGVMQLILGKEAPQGLCGDIDYLPNEHILTANFDRGNLTQYLATKLPSYMVPTHVLVVTKLPLSVSGKIDRKIVDAWLLRTVRPAEPVDACKSLRNLIPKHDFIGLEVCSKVLSMVSEPGSPFFKSLDGTSFLLAAVGLDSIKIIHLIMFIRQRFGVKVHLDILMNPKSSIRTVSDAVVNLQENGGTAATEPKENLMETFRVYKEKALEGVVGTRTASTNIFLTGSTGSLGARILRQLCRDPKVDRVLVHVRGQNRLKAFERIVQSAKLAGWWTDDYVHKLEAWIGDLAKPKLGLNIEQWKRLCGHGAPQERVTAIIHNGATVNWNANFSALKAVNVDSTIDLLKAASESASLTNFVFVSGGQLPRVEADDDASIADEVGQSSGYAQTKFVSELMVKEYACAMAPNQQRVSIVKPGYIIGNKEDGIAATSDFIWRLTAGCAGISSYSAEDPNSWLFISDVDRVASAVSDCCCIRGRNTSLQAAEVIKILDGLPVPDFWSTVRQQLGIEMHPCSADSWTSRLYTSIEIQGENHPLWPLLQTIDQGQGRLGVVCHPPEMTGSDKRRIKGAIMKNVQYLISIGFLSKRKEMQKEEVGIDCTRMPYAIVA